MSSEEYGENSVNEIGSEDQQIMYVRRVRYVTDNGYDEYEIISDSQRCQAEIEGNYINFN